MSTNENTGFPSSSDMNRVAIKLLIGIAQEWSLTDEQCCILAEIDSQTVLQNWRRQLSDNESMTNVPPNTLKRVSYLAGVYEGLMILFTDPVQRRNWIRKPHRDFGGASALDRMMLGNLADLAELRRYLDCWREEHYM